MAIVRRVDHVLTYASDPHILFSVLTERLGCRRECPVARLSGYQCGLVVFGNVFLEVNRPALGRRVGVPLDHGAFGLALEPEGLDTRARRAPPPPDPSLPPIPRPSTLPPGGLFAFDPGSVPSAQVVPIDGLLGDRLL